MRSIHPFLAAGLVLLATRPVNADLVELGDDDRISGRITAIDEQGRVTLNSELSGQPFVVRPEQITRVVFEPGEKPPAKSSDQQVVLRNGDRIPARVLAMDKDAVRVSTWFAGDLVIPRQHVSALHFGVTDPAMVLGGKEASQGWSESEAWTITEEGVFVSGDNGRIARKIKDGLPARFIVRFRLEWKGSPNLRFYFADDLLDQGTSDRYFITINRAGMELKRQSTRGRTNNSLAQDHRQPSDVSPDGMDIEIRVNRDERVLHLLINGDLVDRFVDPLDHVPTGSGLMIESSASGGSVNFVSALEVLEWTDKPQTRSQKFAGDKDSDTVLDRQGEHFSGTAEQISGPADNPRILFRHPHAAEPLQVPLDQAATLFFRQPADAQPPAQPPLSLMLADDGLLALESFLIDDRSARCKHPLLGELTIDRRAIRGLSRPEPQPPES